MKPRFLFLLIVVSATMAPACSPQAAAKGETVVVTLPSADANAGRQAFVDLKCTACHRVPSETAFPPPVSANPGPVFDRRLPNGDFSYLATAMVSPSHRFSGEMTPDMRAHMQGVLSPMGDYSRVMTVQQLADLHAYLHTIGKK